MSAIAKFNRSRNPGDHTRKLRRGTTITLALGAALTAAACMAPTPSGDTGVGNAGAAQPAGTDPAQALAQQPAAPVAGADGPHELDVHCDLTGTSARNQYVFDKAPVQAPQAGQPARSGDISDYLSVVDEGGAGGHQKPAIFEVVDISKNPAGKTIITFNVLAGTITTPDGGTIQGDYTNVGQLSATAIDPKNNIVVEVGKTMGTYDPTQGTDPSGTDPILLVAGAGANATAINPGQATTDGLSAFCPSGISSH